MKKQTSKSRDTVKLSGRSPRIKPKIRIHILPEDDPDRQVPLVPVAVVLVDVAVLVHPALVALVLAHGALEEALASLTAHHPIVSACKTARNTTSSTHSVGQ